jgi:hypothetical protein
MTDEGLAAIHEQNAERLTLIKYRLALEQIARDYNDTERAGRIARAALGSNLGAGTGFRLLKSRKDCACGHALDEHDYFHDGDVIVRTGCTRIDCDNCPRREGASRCACGADFFPDNRYVVASCGMDADGNLTPVKTTAYCSVDCPEIHKAHKRSVAEAGEFCGCSRCVAESGYSP